MSTFLIGDVQGCYKPLRSLLKECGFNAANDRLWFCGDLVNRGPQSADVVRYIMDLGDRARCVLGNHDLNLLAVANGTRQSKPSDTLDNLLSAADADEMLNWIRQQPLVHLSRKKRLCMVHAGIHPSWAITTARKHAQEVEEALRGQHYRTFLRKMYGNTPSTWQKSLSGWERLRFITNSLTRMRFVDNSGVMDFDLKCSPGKQPKKFHPWFRNNTKLESDWLVAYGHWSTLGVYRYRNTVCLDSGCLWGGRLTAMKWNKHKEALRYYSVKCG
jgi:bis(5'-nucleosyl)-tetraphosphatase (symmetrical)